MILPVFIDLVNTSSLIFCFLAVLSAVTGDLLLNKLTDVDQIRLRVSSDNSTHALVAIFSWAAVIDFTFTKRKIMEIIICGMMASFIDLDHFLASKSFRLKAALSLPTRPPFHATTLVIIAIFITLLVQKQGNIQFYQLLPFMIAIAGFSHHIRDGIRRGLWLPPFGSTPPIPHWLYICLLFSLPIMTKICVKLSTRSQDTATPKTSILVQPV